MIGNRLASSSDFLLGPAFTLAVLLVLLAAGHAHAAAGDLPEHPNVLLIVTDDQGYGDLSSHGAPYLKTPVLDHLGAESVRFDRFYVSPVCAPTRASLLTGRNSLATGVRGVSRGEETMRSEEVTIAESLREAGYHTAIFGKWHNGENYPYTPNGQGFDEAFGFNLGHWNNYFDSPLLHNGKPVTTKGFLPDVLTDRAIDFMKQPHNRPFLCYVAYNTPHAPFQLPDQYFDPFKKMGLDDTLASVYGLCANLDHNIGRLLQTLDDEKLARDTIVIFLTDNGPNTDRHNDNMRGRKGSLHEGGTRVPCFIRYPAMGTKPHLVKQIAAAIDIMPTVLDLCHVPLPTAKPIDGKSLVPLLEGNTANWNDRMIFIEHGSIAHGKALGAVRTQKYRLVRERKGDWQLFDMEADPSEKTNIAADHPGLVAKMRDAYMKWWEPAVAVARQTPPPIPVGYKESNPTFLSAAQSEFDGGLQFSNKHANNSWLRNWTTPSCRATWKIDVQEPGDYRVILVDVCPEEDAGSTVVVQCGDAKTQTTIAAAPIVDIPAPDRVIRWETNPIEWSEQPAGVLSLPAGKQEISVFATKIAHKEAMQLLGIKIERVTP